VMGAELRAEMADLRSELKTDIAEVRVDFGRLEGEFGTLRGEFGRLEATIHREFRKQTTLFMASMFTMVGIVTAVTSLAVTLN